MPNFETVAAAAAAVRDDGTLLSQHAVQSASFTHTQLLLQLPM